MSRNDGGPAFPESYEGADAPHEGIGGGMTLRDYAVIQFHAAFIAADHFMYSPEDAARWAEAHADAYLARRDAVIKCDGNHGGPRCADPECWNQ